MPGLSVRARRDASALKLADDVPPEGPAIIVSPAAMLRMDPASAVIIVVSFGDLVGCSTRPNLELVEVESFSEIPFAKPL